jgi:hypothetical protein
MSEEENIEKQSREISSQPTDNNDNVSGPSTTNDNTQTKSMEVHHHPHVEKKKFKEYFLEFLMIFLAVSLGFMAENLREHLSDSSKEKEYIQSLIADLKIDQQVLSQNIARVQSGISMMDTLVTILNTPSQLADNTGKLYYLARLAPRLNPLPINDKTFEQLKNSGNFRLIKNINTSNKITDYYNKVPLVRLLESINETEFTEFKIGASKIFDPAIFIQAEGANNEIKRLNGNPALRSTDNELLQELSVFAVYMHGTKKGILEADTEIKTAGAKLIEYLQKEYHLENE